ncbi:MAG: hypothetical protein GKS05_12445 [Nitrospirales bacterium]|nr:hypothetical protein [Nitrospirales bacterium]
MDKNKSDNVTEQVFHLSSKISLLPVVHGSNDLAQEVREYMLARRLDCLAVALPPSLEHLIEQGIERLPVISLVVLPEADRNGEQVHSYVPIDPCQPMIMGIRLAMHEGIDRAFVDREVSVYDPLSFTIPDPYALKQVSLATYASALLPFMPYPKPDSPRWHRAKWMAFKLHELELEYQSIVCLCPLEDWAWIRQAYQERSPYVQPEKGVGAPALYSVTSSTLYFALCELPFVTECYEQRRAEARSDVHLTIDGMKELLLVSRTRWLEKRGMSIDQETNWVTPQLFQQYLTYVRNLALLEHRLTPDLYTLVLAAQQMAGDDFAVVLLETAKSYAFQERTSSWNETPSIEVGVGQLAFPDGAVSLGKNRLGGAPVAWRSLLLRPAPPKRKKTEWAYRWNPFGQCSWPIEDQRIEGFNAHVREQARVALGADVARVEKFSTSFRDGIDLRETLRHWNPSTTQAPEIYVKDVPPTRGKVEVVVFLFETPADPHKFSWQATWYAEHAEESTLCFYATPFLENMIGPGIGQSLYGGALFLYPPRPIPNVWDDPQLAFAETIEERLLAGAALHSQERHVVVVSPIPLPLRWRKMVKQFQRQLIVIPLSRFSGQLVARLRRFHVLNGHEIRSFASQFIQE